MPRCVVPGCNLNGNHSFPKDLKLKQKWEKACKIKNFRSCSFSRLCYRHFKDSDYQGISDKTGKPQVHRYLKKNAVPSVFTWNVESNVSNCAKSREQRYINRSLRKELFPPQNEDSTTTTEHNLTYHKSTENIINSVPLAVIEIEVETESAQFTSVQTNTGTTTVTTQTPHILRLLSTEEMLLDDETVLFYTGLENIDKFKLVLASLMPMANNLTYRGSRVINMSTEDQLLLMLIKLRRNKEDFELGKLFGISKTQAGNVFVTWINFVYDLWSKLDIWPSRELVTYYMPGQFKRHHPSTRLIVDGTEIPINKPKHPTSQQATFSSYKHHNTVKFLVGATPGGLLCFSSEGYAGSTSDRQITERSSLLTKCDEHDSIMADRGFNVQDLFAHKNITINTPTFLKGLTQLPKENLQRDRKIASNRIHIERLIGLTKTYKILKSDVNPYYVPLLSRIFFVCMMLCNFKDTIVK